MGWRAEGKRNKIKQGHCGDDLWNPGQHPCDTGVVKQNIFNFWSHLEESVQHSETSPSWNHLPRAPRKPRNHNLAQPSAFERDSSRLEQLAGCSLHAILPRKHVCVVRLSPIYLHFSCSAALCRPSMHSWQIHVLLGDEESGKFYFAMKNTIGKGPFKARILCQQNFRQICVFWLSWAVPL
jgi:hypothetical protein